jgi:hypothetical protein
MRRTRTLRRALKTASSDERRLKATRLSAARIGYDTSHSSEPRRHLTLLSIFLRRNSVIDGYSSHCYE